MGQLLTINQKNMKINKLIILASACLLFVTGCKKIEDQFPSTIVKVSYPIITLKGDNAISVHVGDVYTDAGATLTDDITGTVKDIAGDASAVNTAVEGLYFVRYTAANANGYSTTIVRPIAVTGISDAFDISGEYLNAARGGTAMVTKVSRGLFLSDNVNGGGSLGSIYMMIMSDSTLHVPAQWSNDGGFDGDYVDETIYLSPDTAYEYTIDAAGFGTSPRLFEKQ